VFLSKDGYRIELVSPYDSSSVVAGLLARTGNSPYHVCYEVDDLDAEIERLRDARYVVSSEPASAPACGGARVAFLVHPYLGMVELLEKAG
jgi:methylmalonyl-CoA/ethylmalonyl-CoA epimerase